MPMGAAIIPAAVDQKETLMSDAKLPDVADPEWSSFPKARIMAMTVPSNPASGAKVMSDPTTINAMGPFLDFIRFLQ